MSSQPKKVMLGAFFLSSIAAPSAQALLFDQNVTSDVIFGSGNANGAFTVDFSDSLINNGPPTSGIELGLRAKLRFNASNQPENTFNSQGDGTYLFNAGLPPTGFGFASGSTSTALWNFEWSVNSDLGADDTSGMWLNSYTYELGIDFDPGLGTNFLSFDPINVACADHALGKNSTVNGGGTAFGCNDYPTALSQNNVAQNSWNMEFFDDAGLGLAFDGRIDGQYEFYLTAFDSQAGASGPVELARTAITVIVGDGARAEVPAPATLLLVGAGLLALRRKSAL